MATMANVELGVSRLSALLGPCAHVSAVPVDLLATGETVAWLCPDCDVQLPAGWTLPAPSAGPIAGLPWPADRDELTRRALLSTRVAVWQGTALREDCTVSADSSQQYKPPVLSDQWVAEKELLIGERILSWLQKLSRLQQRWDAAGRRQGRPKDPMSTNEPPGEGMLR